MEVHSHTHTPRKKLSHYLWEFLMLFLAVFCGFLAENFREHLVEHQREKEYMHSLVEDLQTDTINLNSQIKFGQTVSSRTQELVTFINNGLLKDSIKKLYELSMRANRIVTVDFEDRTSSQLKNAGEMRLIRNKGVVDSIRSYWSIIKVMDDINDRLGLIKHGISEVSVKLFNSKYEKFSDINNPLESEISILPDAKLINDDPKLMAEYSNRYQHVIIVLNNYIKYMSLAKNQAMNLIVLIKKEYHF